MDSFFRQMLGVLLIVSLICLLVGIVWLIMNAVKHKKMKVPAILSSTSFVLSGIIIFSLLYFWISIDESYVITREKYNNYSNVVKNVNILYNSNKHADSISYSKKVTSAKKAIKEVVNADIKQTDSKRNANTEKIYYSMLNYAIDDSDYTENQESDISEYGEAILADHISKNKSYSADKQAAVKKYFVSKITK